MSDARTSLYAEVTDRIVADLERGVFPWVQPWDASSLGVGLPENARTGRRYSGINILILWDAAVRGERSVQRWVTFRQALELGGAVRKGERGTTVFFADRFTPKGEKKRAALAGDEARAVPFLKRHTVFNVAQCDGLPEEAHALPAALTEREAIPRADAVIAATGAEIRVGGDMAFYVPSQDYIQVPPQQAFFEQINWFRTVFHELGHWSGAASRLDRDLCGRFGSPDYAREELVAEMASAFICAALGIMPTVRHADYLGAWLKTLREDARAIFRAASQASKAAELVLGMAAGVP
jgi:antirestriction protein ArdC